MADAPGFEPVTVEVHGVETTVREAQADDVDGFLELYGRLSIDVLALLRSRGCAYEPTTDPTTASIAQAAVKAGMGVLVCPGPTRGRLHPCPKVSGGHCPLVDDADAVVVVDDLSVPNAVQAEAETCAVNAPLCGARRRAVSRRGWGCRSRRRPGWDGCPGRAPRCGQPS